MKCYKVNEKKVAREKEMKIMVREQEMMKGQCESALLRWKKNVEKFPINTRERKKSLKKFDANNGVKRSHHVHEHHHEMQWTWLVHQKIGVMMNIMCEQSYFKINHTIIG